MTHVKAEGRQFLPLTDARLRNSSRRFSVLILLVIALTLFAMAPSLLELDPASTELWYIVGWVAVPFVAALIALRVAAKCNGSVRKAWRYFGLACLMWIAGTMTWAGYGWIGAVLPFPSLADFFYIATNIFFMLGMFHYSLAGSYGSRMQVTNFALAICAIVAVGINIYSPLLLNSEIGWLGAGIIFAYPAFGFSALAFGLLCYVLYVQDDRRFPLLLILAAIAAHGVANVLYSLDILNESYGIGTFYDVFWIATYAFIAWAALEQGASSDIDAKPAGRARLATKRGEAMVPALAVVAILSSGAAARWPDLRPDAILVLPVMFGFAALLALREYTLIGTERKLQSEAEESARQLGESEARLSGVLENTTDGVIVLDAHWRITFANQKAFGMIAELRLGVSAWDLFPEIVGTDIQRNYVRAMEQQTPVNFEVPFRNVWLEIHAFPTPDSLSVFFRDVTERRRVDDKLMHMARHDPLTDLANRTLFAERLSSGLECGRPRCELTLILIDLDDFKLVNDLRGHQVGDRLLEEVARRLAGLVRPEDSVARLGGDEFAIIQPRPAAPDVGVGIARRISEALRAPFDIEGSQVTVGASIGIAMAPEHGRGPEELFRNADLALYRAKETKGTSLSHCVYEPAMQHHLEARQLQRLELQHASTLDPRHDQTDADDLSLYKARITTALNSMSQGLCMFDADKKLILCNERYAQIYGIPVEHMQPGTPLREILQGRLDSGQFAVGDPQDYLRERIEAVEERQPSVKYHHLTDGRTIAISHSPLEDGGWVATHDDVTDMRRIEARIAHMADHDQLTDLPNRNLFRDELAQELRRGESLAVLSLDLDQFKVVNDALGHSLGDTLLRQAADRLRQVTSEDDFVARLGSNAFAVLQRDVQYPADTKALADRVIASLSQPFELDGNQVVVGASIGIAGAPTDSGDADELLKLAEIALSRCKREGRGTSRFFEPEMNAKVQARRGIEVDLRKALAGNELEIYYQPIVDIQVDRVTGFEALLRWRHAVRGNVSPGEFVPLAEELGLIGELGAWVLEQACAEAARWPSNVRLAVNLSPAQFVHRDLMVDVLAALENSGLPADRLELEITETVMLQDTGATLATLNDLRSLGVHIALDDFGTGFSSLSFVRKFPFDRLKIDRSFIEDMNDDKGSLGIVRAVLALGHSQAMAITAEGVETIEQLNLLRAEGCREVQGYYFSPARPAVEVAGLLTSAADKSRRERPAASIGQDRQRKNAHVKLVQ